jgi:hypothetical protein
MFESGSQASSRAASLEFFNQQRPEKRAEIAGAGVVQLARDFRFNLADALNGNGAGCQESVHNPITWRPFQADFLTSVRNA